MLSVQLLNTTMKEIPLSLQVNGQHAVITSPANSLMTVQIQL